MSNPPPTSDTFFDSEDLMSWLLLNPEIVEFDDSQMQLGQFNDDIGLPSPTNEANLNSTTSSNPNLYVNTAAVNDADVAIKSETIKRPTSNAQKGGKSKPEPTLPLRSPKVGKKRQRESIEDIEIRVNELKSENIDLQAHLMNVTQRTTEVQKQRMAMEKLMVTKLAEIGDREDSDQSELAKVVKQYTDIYADYGKCRQREVRNY